MSNPLAKGRQMLAEKLARAASPEGALSYLPVGGGDPVDLTGRVWVGRTVFVRKDPVARGPAVEFGDRDYLIPVAELAAEPVKGDRLVEQIGTESITFEVLAGAGEPAWRWSDPGRSIYRVHTKEVAREAI